MSHVRADHRVDVSVLRLTRQRQEVQARGEGNLVRGARGHGEGEAESLGIGQLARRGGHVLGAVIAQGVLGRHSDLVTAQRQSLGAHDKGVGGALLEVRQHVLGRKVGHGQDRRLQGHVRVGIHFDCGDGGPAGVHDDAVLNGFAGELDGDERVDAVRLALTRLAGRTLGAEGEYLVRSGHAVVELVVELEHQGHSCLWRPSC